MHQMTGSDVKLLAGISRDQLTESLHFGIASVVAPDGELIAQHGSAEALIYPRSALKPLQALAMKEAGLKLPQRQTVMTMASHHGTPAHIAEIEALLEGHQIPQSALQCPADLPWNQSARAEASDPKSIYMNCSGKHAGFLAASKLNNWPLDNYLSPEHPLQQRVHALVEELSRHEVKKITVDGCGAPLYALTTTGLARAISGFVQRAPELVEAAVAFPELIGDSTTPDAALLKAGVFSKLGAEGVFTAATKDGYSVAIKIADGSLRAAPLVAWWLLKTYAPVSQASIESIHQSARLDVFGGGKPVGQLELYI